MSDELKLIRRLEDGTGEDRELDQAICRFFNVGVTTFPQYEPDGICPRYTGSLDAAIALVERMLPGHPWRVERVYGYEATVWQKSDYGCVDAEHKTSGPHALLIALLRALSQGKTI